MNDYDFLEIGSCSNDTIIEYCPEHWRGFTIDPIQENLDKLPSKKNVTKVCCTIYDDEPFKKLIYIPDEIILNNNRPKGLAGCSNIVNDMTVLGHYKDYLQEKIVKNYSIKNFFEKYKINSVKIIKIDAEGCDLKIMEDLYELILNQPIHLRPNKIIFECFYEQFRNEERLKQIIFKYCIKNQYYHYNPVILPKQENMIFFKNFANTKNIGFYEYS
jgi:hypothetical protein